ncbi:MAG TPA: HAD family hydrolase [Chthoniobacterales bacterium]|nr:HAD family hydrolase [Chthoniobacterales bacterium]
MTAGTEPPKPAVFLDRDGTIMRDVEYCGDPARVELFECATAALRDLKAAGFKLIVITNQSGIGRGYFSEQAYRAVESELNRQLGSGLIDATYYCPHTPDEGCRCRKPAPGLIHDAARDHRVDLSRSFFIGDKPIDAECGRAAGVRTILVATGSVKHEGNASADWLAADLKEASAIILRHAV